MLNVLLLMLGVVLLTLGGESLLRGALGAARRLGVSPLLSGLLIVGFGTSMPELAVTVDAALSNRPDIAIGNIVGSNIGNILLILGLCAMIAPMKVQPLALQRDAVAVIAASLLFVMLVGGSALARPDAFILLMAFFGYLAWAIWTEQASATPIAELHRAESEEVSAVPQSIALVVSLVVVGLLLLVGGSQVMLKGAVGLAEQFGVSEAVIGLTLVAVGTSLPELSITIVAAVRRHADVAIGNILGSNIFNLLGILGISALLQPLPVHARVLQFDQWVMAGSAILLFAFLYTGRRLSRPEAALLLGLYAGYLVASFTIFGD